METPGPIAVLRDDLNELRKFRRLGLKLVIEWFIFFATANYIVLMYFGLKLSDGPLKSSMAFYCVSLLFLAVNGFGVILCWHVFVWFGSLNTSVEAHHARLRKLLNAPDELIDSGGLWPMIRKVVVLIGATVVVMFGTWAALVGATIKSHNSTSPAPMTSKQASTQAAPLQTPKKK